MGGRVPGMGSWGVRTVGLPRLPGSPEPLGPLPEPGPPSRRIPDGKGGGRWRSWTDGVCFAGHDITNPANVGRRANGSRYCRECNRAWRRERYLRGKRGDWEPGPPGSLGLDV